MLTCDKTERNYLTWGQLWAREQFEAVLHAHFSSIYCSKTILIIGSACKLSSVFNPENFQSKAKSKINFSPLFFVLVRSALLISHEKETLNRGPRAYLSTAESLGGKDLVALPREINKNLPQNCCTLILIIEIKIYRKKLQKQTKKSFSFAGFYFITIVLASEKIISGALFVRLLLLFVAKISRCFSVGLSYFYLASSEHQLHTISVS